MNGDVLQRPQLFTRKKLNQLLDSAWNKQFVFLTAPMGYGKTTVVTEYLKEKACKNVEWIRFSQYENNEVIFLNHMTQLFQKNGNDVNFITQRNLEALNYFDLVEYVNLLKSSLREDNVIVLEDYHFCNLDRVNKLIEIVGEVGIPNLHVLIMERFYPDISYVEMQLKGVCELIETDNFRLSKAEVEDFFAQNGCSLTENDVNNVLAYTEGWMAAVYLLCMNTMNGTPLSGGKSVNDLIRTSVFQKLSGEEQDILVTLHALDYCSAQSVNYLTGNDRAAAILFDLKKRIGFIQYTEKNGFEVHSLLRTVATEQAMKQGFQMQAFVRKAFEMCVLQKNYIYALRCLAELKEYDRIFSLFEQYDLSKVYQDEMPTLYQIYKAVPVEVKCKHIKVYLQFVIQYVTYMSYSEGLRLYGEIKEYCDNITVESDDIILCQIAMMEMILEFNHTAKMQQAMRRPLRKMHYQTMLPLHREIARAYAVPNIMWLIHYERGNLKKSISDYELFMLESGWGQDDTYQNIMSTIEMEYYYETGQIMDALRESENLVKKYRIANDPVEMIYAYRIFFNCCILLGKVKEVKQELAILEEDIRQFNYAWLCEDFYLLKTEILYGLNFVKGSVEEEENAYKLKANRLVHYAGIIQSLRGRQLISKRKYDELEMIALQMLNHIDKENFVFKEITGRIYLAIALFHQHNKEEATAVLSEVLDMCSKDGLVMVFVENAIEMVPILESMPETAFSKQVLQRCIECVGNISEARTEKRSLLTPREIEIMELVVIGSKNAEIAEALHVAQITVEKTLTKIYQKLNVKNRASAAKIYEEIVTK